jgi:hypothetical protein
MPHPCALQGREPPLPPGSRPSPASRRWKGADASIRLTEFLEHLVGTQQRGNVTHNNGDTQSSFGEMDRQHHKEAGFPTAEHSDEVDQSVDSKGSTRYQSCRGNFLQTDIAKIRCPQFCAASDPSGATASIQSASASSSSRVIRNGGRTVLASGMGRGASLVIAVARAGISTSCGSRSK